MSEPNLHRVNLFAKVYVDFFIPDCTTDDEDGWYTLPIEDLCKVENIPAGHTKLVIAQNHHLGNAKISDPIGQWHYMKAHELMSCLGRLSCYPLAGVQFANIEIWDYRLNSILCLLFSRTYGIEFDSVMGWEFIPTLHSLLVVGGTSYLKSVSLKGYDHAIPLPNMGIMFDALTRIPNLAKLHLDIQPESPYTQELCAELCSRLAMMKKLEVLQLCGDIFEHLSSGSIIGDILYNGINEAKVRSITVMSYQDNYRAKTYQLSFSVLQQCVCGESATELEEIHMNRVLLTQNHRANRAECHNVRVLDLKAAKLTPCDRMTEDLLGLFPKLVYCRMDYCAVKSFVPVAEYLGKNKSIRELHMVGNKLEQQDYYIVMRGLKWWKHLRILNLRKNPVAITNKMRGGLAEEMYESGLENFVWQHGEWRSDWDGDWKRLTAALCIHQMHNILEDKKAELGGEISDWMWPKIFETARRMGLWDNTSRKYVDKQSEYKGNQNSSWYKASVVDSRKSDTFAVIHWLLTKPYAEAIACGASILEVPSMGRSNKRKRLCL